MMTTSEWIQKRKIIVVIRGIDNSLIVPLGEALIAGGIDLAEITFVQDRPDTWEATAEAIRMLSAAMQGKMLIGAGTVLNLKQLAMAKEAGARFIISPNANPVVIHQTKEEGLCSIPGAFSATEIVNAYEAGADIVKVFPAGAMGAAWVKDLKTPLSHIPMLAVAGINESNAADFLKAGCCGFAVSSDIVRKEWLETGAWNEIMHKAEKYRKLVENL